jgi:hypothetical protein
MNLKPNSLLTMTLVLFLVFLFGKTPLHSELTGTVKGQVLDKETLKGIAGVIVKISSAKESWTLETDENGEFLLTEVEPGELEIVFLPPPPYALPLLKRSEFHSVILARGKNLNIVKKLDYGGTIIGRVYEKSTNALLKVEVVSVYWHLPSSINIGNDGEFRIERLRPGVHTLAFYTNGFGMREIKNIKIENKETKRMDFSLDSKAPTKVIGKVICKTNREPVGTVQVTLLNEDRSLYSETYTNEDGYYSFKDLIPGEYIISIIGLKPNGMPNETVEYEKTFSVESYKTAVVSLKVDCSLEFDFI